MNARKINKSKRIELIFYILMLAYPVAQFCVFYIGVNFNSILLAFQKIDVVNNEVLWTLDNFKTAFYNITLTDNWAIMITNSVKSYLLLLVIGTPLGLFFSYYIAKKFVGAKVFRVLLFLPSILSSIVLTTIFHLFVENGYPELMKTLFDIQAKGLIENEQTRYSTIIFFNLFTGFGVNVLMYANAITEIPEEMVEAAHLDGAVGFTEFWHITLPSIFPTVTTFLIIGVASIFTNQYGVFAFYAETVIPPELNNLGLFMYTETLSALSDADYPILATYGLLMSCVAIPLTYLVKWFLGKVGPSED